MKHLLLNFFVLVVLQGSALAHATTLPADTVAGQARFTHLISSKLCEKITKEAQKTDFTKLSPPESEALFKNLLQETLGDNYIAFSTLLEGVPQAKQFVIGRTIGEEAVMSVVKGCPGALPLVTNASRSHIPGNTEITAAERAVLLPLTQEACRRLDEESAKTPYAELTPTQRNTLFERVLQGVFLSKSQDLTGYYGDDIMDDQEKGGEIGKKVALLMLEVCPTYIMQAGRDALEQRRQATASPRPAVPAKPGATPAKKLPAKPRTQAAKVR